MKIEKSQIWKDHDRRRTEEGSIRTIKVLNVFSTGWVECLITDGPSKGKSVLLRGKRFKPSANDGFELVSEPQNEPNPIPTA
jgi:hypothetical protein